MKEPSIGRTAENTKYQKEARAGFREEQYLDHLQLRIARTWGFNETHIELLGVSGPGIDTDKEIVAPGWVRFRVKNVGYGTDFKRLWFESKHDIIQSAVGW